MQENTTCVQNKWKKTTGSTSRANEKTVEPGCIELKGNRNIVWYINKSKYRKKCLLEAYLKPLHGHPCGHSSYIAVGCFIEMYSKLVLCCPTFAQAASKGSQPGLHSVASKTCFRVPKYHWLQGWASGGTSCTVHVSKVLMRCSACNDLPRRFFHQFWQPVLNCVCDNKELWNV